MQKRQFAGASILLFRSGHLIRFREKLHRSCKRTVRWKRRSPKHVQTNFKLYILKCLCIYLLGRLFFVKSFAICSEMRKTCFSLVWKWFIVLMYKNPVYYNGSPRWSDDNAAVVQTSPPNEKNCAESCLFYYLERSFQFYVYTYGVNRLTTVWNIHVDRVEYWIKWRRRRHFRRCKPAANNFLTVKQ